MVSENKSFLGLPSPTPGFASEIAGAPVSVPRVGGGKPQAASAVTEASGLSPQHGVEGKGDGVEPGGASAVTEGDDGGRKEEEDAVIGYDKQIAALEAAAAAVKLETPEEKAKRERVEKSKRVIAATADGLSALSNLFFTAQYAPNSYNPQSSQLGKVNGRIEALKAEREADAERYSNLMLRLGDTQNARAKTIRDIRAQHEAQKLAREKAERDAESHSWQALLQPDKQREQKGKAYKAEQDAISAWYEAENKPRELELENRYREAGIVQRKAAATASYASAENSRESAKEHTRGNKEEFFGLSKNGKYEQFRTRQAAIDFERRQGTYAPSNWGDDVVTDTKTTEDLDGNKTTTSKKIYPDKKGKGYGEEEDTGKGKGYGN